MKKALMDKREKKVRKVVVLSIYVVLTFASIVVCPVE